ncbi:TetR/AcrR family transcriptional regulator [Lacisediminihabitans sp.]|uniref:TetR/AcrR family transcriptional regulator n=1 Tax=Lacisediminihabitans sp. TaxID=2787631 RepID=UPI00374D302F
MARTNTSAREGADARERILAAALDEFSARGYRAATIGRIATGAGMSRAGILHHFENKQALLLALLDARDDELRLRGPAIEQGAESATELLASMQVSIRRILDGRELIKLAHMLTAEAADADHPAHDWLVQRSRRLRASMRAAFDSSFERGELAPDADSRTLAALMLGAVEGLEAQWLADPDEVDVAEGIALFDLLIRRALAT